MKVFTPLHKGYQVVFSPSVEALAKILKVDLNRAKELCISRETILWTGLNMAREYYKDFIQTTPGVPLITMRQDAKEHDQTCQADLIKAWKIKRFSNIQSLIEYYEATICPALQVIKKINSLKAENYSLKDVLRLRMQPAAELEKVKNRLQIIKDQIADLQMQLEKCSGTSFSTEVYNSLLNIFRLCGEIDAHAHRFALQLLDDMTALKVPFDESTKLLLKKICFDDNPKEDSEMFFSLVEVPEMGELVLNPKSVQKLNERAIEIAADRHNITITEGRYITSEMSHPNLIDKA